MTTPDPRTVAAMARRLLPEGYGAADLRSLADVLEEMYALEATRNFVKEGEWDSLRHIADQLDGPLAEAWERSVKRATENCEQGEHTLAKAAMDEWPDWCPPCFNAALRAIEETGDK